MTVVICLEAPVEKGIHPVHYPLCVDYLVAHEWVCLLIRELMVPVSP